MDVPGDVLWAFVLSVEDAHRVASHILRSEPPGTFVGFNKSKRDEGYLIVDASVDVGEYILTVTGAAALRVLTTDELRDDPQMWGTHSSV